MKQQALGMIETKGLVPAIEAGDAGVKAANVQLLGYEIVKGGLVMVAFVGDVAAVQASVSAGSAAASKVGLVISEHVIPRPEADLRMIFKGNSEKSENNDPEPEPEGPDEPEKYDLGETVPDIELDNEPIEEKTGGEDEVKDDRESTGDQESTEEDGELELMTVGELRRLARKTPGIGIHGREISRANKEQLIKEILRARGGAD